MGTPHFVVDLREKIGHAPLWMPGVKGVVLRAVDMAGAAPEVLLVQRRDNGRWTVPAGILEPGEQPADGVAREVLEETGVVARPTALAGVQVTDPVVYPNGDRAQYLDVVVALEPVGGQARVNDDENLAVQWRALDALDDVPPLHRRAIRWAAGLDPRFSSWAPVVAAPGHERDDTVAADGAAWFLSDGVVARKEARER